VIDREQFIDLIIEPTLEELGMFSAAASELVLGTAIQESRLTYIKQLGTGPALGVCQMEPILGVERRKSTFLIGERHMNLNTLVGAVIAALILFFTGMLALLQTEGVESISDIGQIPWIVLGVGSLVSFLKDYQAISTRRLVNKITGSGDGGGVL